MYDDWYARLTDVDVTVRTIAGLAGTGRPRARARCRHRPAGRPARRRRARRDRHRHEHGDARSAGRARSRTGRSPSCVGDMVDDLPDGPFDVALRRLQHDLQPASTEERQQALLRGRRRTPRARRVAFVVEAFVPDAADVIGGPSVDGAVDGRRPRGAVGVGHDPTSRRASGQFVEITETGGVRLRPWSIRWATPEQLDAMAASAGFDARVTVGRHGGRTVHRRQRPPRVRLPLLTASRELLATGSREVPRRVRRSGSRRRW